MSTKIIMDTDPGIDDAAAITFALNHPDLDLQLITTVAGNVTVDKTTLNALKLTRFFNSDVPVAGGAAQPLIKPFEDAVRIHGVSGMPGYDFPTDLAEPLPETAVEALRDYIMAAEQPITLVPTGAYTNIALLFKTYPEVMPHIKEIVAMGGALGKGNMTSAAEFNVFTDPHAAEIMYQSGVPITMVGLDVTMKALLTRESIEQLPTLGKLAKCFTPSLVITTTATRLALRCMMSIRSSTYYIQKPLRLKGCGLMSRRRAPLMARPLAIFVVLTMTAKPTRPFVSILMRLLSTSGS
ncbi:Ribosylpyrimidine nucleosidase [Lactiplantibacillus plantarum subsp. plantarum]|nr:Ribosylpyrimidine nucleosidase [Lactiplantibacillus plantarum subsp. plantarum]